MLSLSHGSRRRRWSTFCRFVSSWGLFVFFIFACISSMFLGSAFWVIIFPCRDQAPIFQMMWLLASVVSDIITRFLWFDFAFYPKSFSSCNNIFLVLSLLISNAWNVSMIWFLFLIVLISFMISLRIFSSIVDLHMFNCFINIGWRWSLTYPRIASKSPFSSLNLLYPTVFNMSRSTKLY